MHARKSLVAEGDVVEIPAGERFEKCELEIQSFMSRYKKEIIDLSMAGLVSEVYFDVGHFVENDKLNTTYRLSASFLKLLS